MRKVFETMRDTRTKLDAVLTPEQQKEIPQFGRGGRGGPGGRNRPGGNTGGDAPAPPATPPADSSKTPA